MNAAGSVYDASTSPPLVSQGATGAISGGILRPGSIDQGTFLTLLQQQQQNREAAGVGGKPVSMPVPSFQNNIPTLSSAQFAALVGGASDSPPLGESDGGAADPQAVAQDVSRAVAPTTAAQVPTMPAAPALKLSGRPALPAGMPVDSGADSNADPAPIFTRNGPGTLQASATDAGTAEGAAAPDAGPAAPNAATAEEGKSAEAAKTPPSDPNVVHLKDAPDRETQRNLMAAHKRWVVDETPGSRQLFFGPDGEFGWDDFLDVINPLQHIPIVAQIYRAVTGDQIYGAADLIGSLPLGPIGIIGTMGAVANLAVKDTTGKDIGDNLEAMVFGPGTDKTGTGGTAADSSGLAEATPAHPDPSMQTASAEPFVTSVDAERQAHDQRKA